MGFDIYGQAPSGKVGEYFHNDIWWWRPLQVLIYLSCDDILSAAEEQGLAYNDGYCFSPDKAMVIADRLAAIVADDEWLAIYKTEVMKHLPSTPYTGCWSKENVLEFVEFLKHSGGFKVS